jgi:hypothetical protein
MNGSFGVKSLAVGVALAIGAALAVRAAPARSVKQCGVIEIQRFGADGEQN